MGSSSSSSPCAACKFLRRKCTEECVLGPYFPPDQPHKFSYVHKIFGASNVAKLLNDLASNQREDAVNSLFYEAEARLRDPVYGCVGLISILQHRLKQLQQDLDNAKKEIAAYVAPPPPSTSVLLTHHHHNMLPTMAIPTGQQHIFEAQQVNAVARDQHNHMFRAYGVGSNIPHHHHHQNLPHVDSLRFHNGFDSVPTGSVTVTRFNQLSSSDTTVTGMSPSLAPTNDNYHTDQHEAQRVEGVSLVRLGN